MAALAAATLMDSWERGAGCVTVCARCSSRYVLICVMQHKQTAMSAAHMAVAHRV